MEALLVVFLIVGNIASAGYCQRVAMAKNLSAVKWGLGGFFFGIIALIALVGMPSKNS